MIFISPTDRVESNRVSRLISSPLISPDSEYAETLCFFNSNWGSATGSSTLGGLISLLTQGVELGAYILVWLGFPLDTTYLLFSRSTVKALILLTNPNICMLSKSFLGVKAPKLSIIFLKDFQISWHCSLISFRVLLRSRRYILIFSSQLLFKSSKCKTGTPYLPESLA